MTIKSMKIKVREMNRLLPAEIHQEETIIYLEKLIEDFEIEVGNISFSTESISDISKGEETNEDSIESLLNNYVESNPSKIFEDIKDKVFNKDENANMESGIKSFDVGIDFSGKYKNVKEFIDKLESNNRLIGIHELFMMLDNSEAASEDLIFGGMNLIFPFYEDGSSSLLIWSLENDYGKSNLFSDASTFGYVPDMSEFNRSDFYIFLDPVESDLPTVTLGKTPYNYTAVYNDSSSMQEIKLVLKNDDSGFVYRYENAYSAYPLGENAFEAFEPANGNIAINVYIRAEDGASSIPGARLTVENETRLPVSIHVIGDNPDNPAFSYSAINGGDVKEIRIN
jgi:hypothetical protein